MQITLTSGLLSYTNTDGSTGSINLNNEVDAQIVNGFTISAGANTTGPLMVSKPIVNPYWIVRIHLVDQRYLDIYMGGVSNQATWVNTQAGANLAIAAIVAAH